MIDKQQRITIKTSTTYQSVMVLMISSMSFLSIEASSDLSKIVIK